jgi:arginyl-tRNA synthetase
MRESLIQTLRNRVAAAIARLTAQPADAVDPQLRIAQDPQFGDYQCNAALGLARELKQRPRDVAQRIIDAAELSDLTEPPEIAGPGFINLRIRREHLARYLGDVPAPPAQQALDFGSALLDSAQAAAQSTIRIRDSQIGFDRLGIAPTNHPLRVVIDYSSPNIAKQMHVGHLRSTIIGDVFARVLAFEGHQVILQNHIGDWGTAIGMVILGSWYIQSRCKRGERFDAIEARLRALSAARTATPERRRELLAPIAADWSADVRDAALCEGFADAPLTLEQLELGYQFIQALSACAAGLDCTVTDDHGQTWDLATIPREVTRMLQQGGQENRTERRAWERARAISLQYCNELYRRLGVLLNDAHVCGESFYEQGDRLPRVVAELREKLPPRPADRRGRGPWCELRDDRGAACIFCYDENGEPAFRGTQGDALPMIIQKSDGAYLYATTDLAAIRYRVRELGARRIIYVVGAPQRLHLQMLFTVARAAGFAADAALEHTPFGSVLGDDRKPLRTREGGNVRLAELLDEAERRALALLRQRRDESEARRRDPADADEPPPAEAEQIEIARRVGIAAVKYADLVRDRNSDYVFSWDKMLTLQGNTAPYLLYAYARIRSIYRKTAQRFGTPDAYSPAAALALDTPQERALALRLARLHETIERVAAELMPHELCTYLYELAADFMRFYETCPVLAAADDATRTSRMRLCDLTARTLRLGLGLLGIETIERM